MSGNRLILPALVLTTVLVMVSACGISEPGSSDVSEAAASESSGAGSISLYGDGVHAEFYQKVDGDTAWFTVDGEQIKVRFLGIDTPETVKEGVEVQEWGPEASDYTADRLENARSIYLEYDPNSDRTDAYDRTLAWVWVDGSLLETELVERGYAEVAYIYGDYLHTDELYEAQQRAQASHVGLWSDSISDDDAA